ncbi:type II toxin-antitoxin system prevent-host-death family antitoxin [Azoarcus sp. PA01]|nr:type II toxin-antitoxin system prevent-host-death family antitoxin [Azoarcus sp. PA01]
MRPVPVFEAKNRLSELLTLVERGEEIAITRRGVAVARLVAMDADASSGDAARRQAVGEVFADLRRLRESFDLEMDGDGDLKAIAREGLA